MFVDEFSFYAADKILSSFGRKAKCYLTENDILHIKKIWVANPDRINNDELGLIYLLWTSVTKFINACNVNVANELSNHIGNNMNEFVLHINKVKKGNHYYIGFFSEEELNSMRMMIGICEAILLS